MSENRSDKINALRRQEDRNKRLPVLFNAFQNTLRITITEDNVLTLEQIDIHQININSSDFNFNFLNLSFPFHKADDLKKLLFSLKDKLSVSNYFTLSQFSEIAVFKIKTDFLIEKFEDLIKIDKNTITIYDTEYKNGLWMDLYEEYWYLDGKAARIPIYELRVFGKEWMKLVNENW